MNEKISLCMLKAILNPHQMRNVLGGSSSICPDGHCWIRCNNGSAGCTDNCDKACVGLGGVDYCWC